MKDKFLWCQNLCSFESKHICNAYLHYLSCCASFSCKSTKLMFQQQPVQQAIQTLHQQQYLWYLQCMISFRLFFFQWCYHKESASLLLLWSRNIWNSVWTQFIFFPQLCVSKFITYIELNRLQCVFISLLRKDRGYKFCSRKVKRSNG